MSVYLIIAGDPATVRGAFGSVARATEAARSLLTPGEHYRIQDWLIDYPVAERTDWYEVPLVNEPPP